MIGTTLDDLRDRIESLADDEGRYYLVCGRYGDRPVPATGLRFESRATARAAARATEQYRQALRRYDPQLPHYDVIVCQTPERAPPDRRCPAGGDASVGRPAGDPGPSPDRPDAVEFCHRVAAAVFETLSQHGHDAVEAAVMDAYFELAEVLTEPTDLCLCLLESMATEVDAGLSPAAQAAVLTDAADRVELAATASDPVEGAFEELRRHGLLDEYSRSPWSVDLDGGPGSAVVRLSGYALSPRDGRLPVLPIAVALARLSADSDPGVVAAAETSDGWRLRLERAQEVGPLATAPIDAGESR